MVSHETLPLLEVHELSKSYGSFQALNNISLVAHPGEIISLVGPSGSGKSTILRSIAGLEQPDSGRLLLRGHDITQLPPHRRGFGLMFQHYALFPHRTVAENVAFGLKMQGVSFRERQARATEMLALVGLAGYARRIPSTLSGGEQQRVALARSLAPRPTLLMLDEPLGALDRSLRERLLGEMHAILKALATTALYVTHDQQEAFAISDRLILLHQGSIVQQGIPETVYQAPANRFVAEFFGLTNIVPVQEVRAVPSGGWMVRTVLGWLRLSTPTEPTNAILIRPEAAQLAGAQEENTVVGQVQVRSFQGSHTRLRTRHPGNLLLDWELPTSPGALPQPDETLTLRLQPEAIMFITE